MRSVLTGMSPGHRRTRVLAGVVLAPVVVALAACSALLPLSRSDQPTPIEEQAPERTPQRTPERTGLDAGEPPPFEAGAPPPVTVRAGTTTFDLEAWTYCYGNMCVDGGPPADPPDVGTARAVEIEFPLKGWTFDAEFVPVGDDTCPRRHSVPVEKTGERTYLVEPAGRADTYDVTLFGRGNGDLFVTFRWTTPHDGPMPVPDGRLAVLADHDGSVDSYGVELALSDLAATPRSATALVKVTAANGASSTFKAVRAKGCLSEGTVFWDGPERAGVAAARLGPAPFTYDVVVVLDGVRHSARAIWPDDEIDGNEPSVSLDFSPPLPALP